MKLGAASVTDPSTASRTQLYGLAAGGWAPFLLNLFGVDPGWLPQIRPGAAYRGSLTHPVWGSKLPWHAGLVDQVAALLGCGCLEPGEVNVTYGTGAFVLAQAGGPPKEGMGLLCSVSLSDEGGRTFEVE